ncbi:endonuclease [Gelidibacter salicanalis]|uniref:Endonuclease n=1 Tax=Gelidibacter salicanalis TaxID=291193 RepID=A0A934NER2_9FLAO|nr:endonuclease [Gelidibacter salicanalis]MBJ7882960.1 endonuclease [Gelidibacter salicanalis]
MAKYQLPALKNETEFEEFICDLFNEIENTETYTNTEFQLFGTKGQNQKGIDIFSLKTKKVIQCKLKSLKRKDELLRKEIISDIDSDLEKIKNLNFKFDRLIFTSTFRDDAKIQEYVSDLSQKSDFNINYWGWDTISKHAEESETILKKYFPKLFKKAKTQKIELPENSLGRDLLKKNYATYLIKRYGDWKQIELARKNEKFNWASFNKHIINKYKASGINYIHINHFENLAAYLKSRIDKTIMGKTRTNKGHRNYSTFEEHTEGITE